MSVNSAVFKAMRRPRLKRIVIFCIGALTLWTVFYLVKDQLRKDPHPDYKPKSSIQRKLHKPLILLWTPGDRATRWPAGWSRFNARQCPATCEFTRDNSRLLRSDVIVVNEKHLTKTNYSMPVERSQWQRLVIFIDDSPAYMNPEDLKRHDPEFNWTMSYRRNADIWFPYGFIWKIKQNVKDKNQFQSSGKHRKNLVMWVADRCVTDSRRHKYALQLRRHVQVDIFGKCAVSCEQQRCDALAKKYIFYLAFENSICTDFVTGKVYKAFELGLIPIVLGGAHYKRILPPKSYIDIADFKSPKELANFLHAVATDETLYNSFFQWKSSYKIMARRSVSFGLCSLCLKATKSRSLPQKSYPSIHQWWFEDTCAAPEKKYPHLMNSVFNLDTPEEKHFGLKSRGSVHPGSKISPIKNAVPIISR